MLADKQNRLIWGFPWCLVLYFSVAMAAPQTIAEEQARLYAIQLESSRTPHLADYEVISEYGTLYTYRPRGAQGLVRVRMGYYRSRAAAGAALEKIRAQGFSDAYLSRVRDPGRDRVADMAPLPLVKTAARPPETSAAASPEAEVQVTRSAELPPAARVSAPVPAMKPSPLAKKKSRRSAEIAGPPIPDPFAE